MDKQENNRTITVFSRSEIQKIDLKNYDGVISVVGFNTHEPVAFFGIRSLLALVFDDVLEEGMSRGTKCFTEEHAKGILNFVKVTPNAARLAVHCDAGISRSAGVARGLELCGLAKWDNGDAKVWDADEGWRSRFAPNSTVFLTLLKVNRT